MSVGPPFPRSLAFSFALIAALGCAATAAAQSGRRAPKSSPAPVAAPTPEPTPAGIALEKPKPVLQFVIGIDRYDSFSSVSLASYNAALRSCANQLDEPPSVSVETVERSLSRGEATNRAKAEKKAYVVWLRIREDNMSSGPTGTPNNVYIEYMVLAPITAKVVSSGSAYPRRRGILPGSRSSDIYGDREIIDAARAVASKILAAMHMHIPRSFN